MRYPLATDLKSRTGAPDKDARLKNAYVEARGDTSAVRKRPAAQGGVAVGSGTAQGGIGLTIGGVDYIYTVNGDTGALDTLASAGTDWASGSSYSVGDHVSVGFVDYWFIDSFAADNNGGIDATSPASSPRWSATNPALGVCGSYVKPEPSITGVSTTGPFGSSPSIPASYQLSTSVVGTLSCGGTLHENVLVVYTVREVADQYKYYITGATRLSSSYFTNTDMADISGSLPVTYYDSTLKAAITQSNALFSSFAASGATWNYIPYQEGVWEFVGYYVASGGGLDGIVRQAYNITTGAGSGTQTTIYYLDATSWKYYTIT